MARACEIPPANPEAAIDWLLTHRDDGLFRRWESIPDRWRFVEGSPDLAVEVLSPNEQAPTVPEKVRICLEAGTPHLWGVDPHSHTVHIWTPGSDQPVVLGPSDTLVGDPVLPGFRCQVTDLFE